MRERKRLIRLLVTDVTLVLSGEHIDVHVRLSGGVTHSLAVPRPPRAWELHTTQPTTIALIDELLDDHPCDETVRILNGRGLTGGWGKPFSVPSLTQLCRLRAIPDHRQRLRAAGMLTVQEIAHDLGVTPHTIKIWQRRGDITGRRVDGRRECLYHPGQVRPPDGVPRWVEQPGR
ncbi:MAG: MerR family transcriptional regulator [Acidimicrobiales bacterium]